MSENIQVAIFTSSISAIISIIGFIITNHTMKKNFENELKKHRDTISLDKMATIPFQVLQLLDKMVDLNDDKDNSTSELHLQEFKEILNTIYSYGSEDAIRIVSLMQQENFAALVKTITLDRYRLVSEYILLATQIKYDVTGIAVSPELWLQMKLSDYYISKEEIKIANNLLVEELNLIKNFKIF